MGGGTPSLIPAADFSLIIDTLTKLFSVSKDTEMTLEVNPGTVTDEKRNVPAARIQQDKRRITGRSGPDFKAYGTHPH